jgi:hypothetical protein
MSAVEPKDKKTVRIGRRIKQRIKTFALLIKVKELNSRKEVNGKGRLH